MVLIKSSVDSYVFILPVCVFMLSHNRLMFAAKNRSSYKSMNTKPSVCVCVAFIRVHGNNNEHIHSIISHILVACAHSHSGICMCLCMCMCLCIRLLLEILNFVL